MAQPLDAMQAKYSNYSNYSNYSKLAAGKFHHLFGGQFFFDTRKMPEKSWVDSYLPSGTDETVSGYSIFR